MVDEFEPREVPDWPMELAEPVARLGPPHDVFRIPPSHAVRRALYGLSLIVAGGIMNYVYWVVINGPFMAEHILLFLLLSPIFSGAGLIYVAWRDRGLWALIYPMGLLRWQRGEVVTFPWADVAAVSFFRVVECERPQRMIGPQGEWQSSWLPIAKMGSRTLGAHLVLRREDGSQAILPSSIARFKRLCQVVQEETFRVMWKNVWRQYLDGAQAAFGDLSVSRMGIHRNDDLLSWRDLDDATIQEGKLIIRSRRARRAWQEVPLHKVANPHVLAAMLMAGRQHELPEAASQSRRERKAKER